MFSNEIPVPVAVSGCPPLCLRRAVVTHLKYFLKYLIENFWGRNAIDFGPTVWILNPCVECFIWKLFRSDRKSRHQIRNFNANFRWTVGNAQNSMHFYYGSFHLFLGVQGGCTILWKPVSSACPRSLRHRVTEWHATEQLPSQKSIETSSSRAEKNIKTTGNDRHWK